jgi:hypothetical protein
MGTASSTAKIIKDEFTRITKGKDIDHLVNNMKQIAILTVLIEPGPLIAISNKGSRTPS